MRTEQIVINADRNVTLTAYFQTDLPEIPGLRKRPAVLILPGGGYMQCSEIEIDPVAFHYLSAGYQVFILRYSVGENAVWPNPLTDYESAVSLMRQKADDWNLYPDKIAVVGFSAGGHLAACASVMAENRPNAAILGYSITDGETVSAYLPSAPDAAAAVDEHTCPCFVFASRTDTVVPVKNSVEMLSALTKYDISYECHIYAYGGHGFSSCDKYLTEIRKESCSRVPRWITDSTDWQEDIFGSFSEQGMEKPRCKSRFGSDHDPYYSIECTAEYLEKNEETRKVIWPVVSPLLEYMHTDQIPAQMKSMTFRELMGYMQIPAETAQAIDQALKNIPK